MVEICLRALDALDSSPHKDAYVSVRVGEMQKFSKLSAAKKYKFPASAAKDRHSGKVELFQRIGACTVALDGCVDEVQEVYLPTAAGDCRFSVEIGGGTSDITTTAAEPHTRKSSFLVAAKSYLEKHCLEARLAQAVQAILRDQPEDPVSFLTAHLAAGASQISPPSMEAPSPARAEIPSAEGVATSSPPDVVRTHPSEVPQVVPFRTYYNAHMNAHQPEQVFGSIHAKFAPRAQPATELADDVEAEEEILDQPEQCEICSEPFEQGAPFFSHATDIGKGICPDCMAALRCKRPTNCTVCEAEFEVGCPIFGSPSDPSRFLCQSCVRLVPGGPLSAIAENDEDAASTHISKNLLDDVTGIAAENVDEDGASTYISENLLDDVTGIAASAGGPPSEVVGRAATKDAAAILHHALVEGGASPNAAAVMVIREHACTTGALRGY